MAKSTAPPPLVPVGGQINLMGYLYEVVAHKQNAMGQTVEVPGRLIGRVGESPAIQVIKPDGTKETKQFEQAPVPAIVSNVPAQTRAMFQSAAPKPKRPRPLYRKAKLLEMAANAGPKIKPAPPLKKDEDSWFGWALALFFGIVIGCIIAKVR